MGNPTSERGAMQQIIRALIADGWRLTAVSDPDRVKVKGERQAIEVIESTGVAHLYVARGEGDALETGWVFFVLGNDPSGEEVAADWTTNLTAVDRVTDGWE